MKTVRTKLVAAFALTFGAACKNEVYSTQQCLGNGSVTENYRHYTFTVQNGPAIDVAGNCSVILTDCTVTAPIGIRATENAVVTVRGGRMTGKEHLVTASGNARIVFENVETQGQVSQTGSATVSGLAR
jgi:hypothetical protein